MDGDKDSLPPPPFFPPSLAIYNMDEREEDIDFYGPESALYIKVDHNQPREKMGKEKGQRRRGERCSIYCNINVMKTIAPLNNSIINIPQCKGA